MQLRNLDYIVGETQLHSGLPYPSIMRLVKKVDQHTRALEKPVGGTKKNVQFLSLGGDERR